MLNEAACVVLEPLPVDAPGRESDACKVGGELHPLLRVRDPLLDRTDLLAHNGVAGRVTREHPLVRREEVVVHVPARDARVLQGPVQELEESLVAGVDPYVPDYPEEPYQPALPCLELYLQV